MIHLTYVDFIMMAFTSYVGVTIVVFSQMWADIDQLRERLDRLEQQDDQTHQP